MAALIRTLFKSKKVRKEDEPATDIIFQPCTQRQPTARFADDCQLPPATAAYHTSDAPKRRKGPQSCPGGYREDAEEEPRGFLKKKSSMRRRELLSHSSRQDFMIDVDREPQNQHKRHRSRPDLRGHSQWDIRASEVHNDENQMEAMERKSQFYLQKWESSERQRKEEKRKQELLEKERNSIQNAMSNMAYCMASVQQMEQLKKERDQFKKEMSRYKTKCEKLESKYEKLESATMSPNFAGFQQNPLYNFHQSSPYNTPQFPAPMSFNYPNNLPHHRHPANNLGPQHAPPSFPTVGGPVQPLHRSTNFLNAAQPTSQLFHSSSRSSGTSHRGPSSFTSTTSGGAGESLANPADITFMRESFFQPSSQILSGSAAIRDHHQHHYNLYDDDEDEVKNFRAEQPLPTPSPYSELTQSSDNDNAV